MSVTTEAFGKTREGKDATLYTLENAAGLRAQITDYGGIVVSLLVPDKWGRRADVVLGYDGLEGYLKNPPYFGAIIGRCANRIANASFYLHGTPYALSANFGKHHLHGGSSGFDKALWRAKVSPSEDALSLSYRSVDGEEGYPGNLDVTVTYSLTAGNALRIDYEAVSDQDTLVNLTNHSYFNLAGHDGPEIVDHKLQIEADHVVAIDSGQLPTGELLHVGGTPMDFRISTKIRPRLESGHEQIVYGNGLDHCWVLAAQTGALKPAARIWDPVSGRVLEVSTTMPGVQVFTPDFSSIKVIGKHAAAYKGRCAICFETQYYPNAVWHPHFPSPVLPAGQRYSHTTVFQFSADDFS